MGDEALLDDVNFFLDHIHRLEEVIVKLLPYLLNLRLQVLFCFGLAEFEELGLEFLAGSRDALTKHSLIVRHVLPERLLLEHGDTLLSDLLVCLLQNRLVKSLFCREKRPLHLPIIALNRLFYRAIALILADVRPGILDVGHGTLVDRRSVGGRELKKHFACYLFAIELLWSDFLENLGPQLLHLLDKLRSQLLICHALQALKLTFLFNRSDKSGAIPVREYLLDQAPNTILVID